MWAQTPLGSREGMRMKETKFRIWDTVENKWYEPIYNDSRGELHELLIIPHSGRLVRRNYSTLEDESLFPGRYIKHEFTGLVDKNGKEIFEGDIVDIGFESAPVHFGQYICSEDHGQKTMMTGWIGGDFPLNSRAIIIGNIFENPELLK